jgi:two-component system sensor histidine kinase VicK
MDTFSHPSFSLLELAQRTEQLVFMYRPTVGVFTYLNPATEAIWGRKREDIAASPCLLLQTIHPDDQAHVTDLYGQLLVKKKVSAEFRILLPDGTQRWVLMQAYLVTHDYSPDTSNGNGRQEEVIIGYANDISQQKEYQNNLQKFADMKNSVLEILSHDLAGPLARIQGLSEHLGRITSSYENTHIDEVISLVIRTSQHGIQLIREFVDQEFLESAQVALVKQRTDLIARTRVVMDQYQSEQQHLGKTFQLHTSSPVIMVNIDETKFMQVINNLLSNAIKFTRDDSLIIVRIMEQNKKVLITVEDNGIGIPQRLQASLFDKFTKARRPGIKGEPTVGLGMSIIKTIVDWHHGRIWFESQEGKGTRFFIEIPCE